MALHEIRRSRPGETVSGILPASALPIGTPLKIGSMDAATGERTFVVADGQADGFMTRASRTTPGLTDEEQLFGFGLETPFLAGASGTIELAQEIVIEGADYIKGSSTGAITSGTTAGTQVSFDAGLFYVAQVGDVAQWEVVKQLTPEVSGNVRLHLKAISGYVVPPPDAPDVDA